MIDSRSIARNLEQPEKNGNGEPNDLAARNLNVLMISQSPSLRAVRMAAALKGRGHAVSLACTEKEKGHALLSAERISFDKVIPIESPGQLWQTASQYDVLHCLDRSGSLTVLSLGGARPVIHDAECLDSEDPVSKGLAFRASDGCVYATPLIMKAVQDLYAPEGPGLVLPSMASRREAGVGLAKLSAEDNAVHLAAFVSSEATASQSRDMLISLARQGLKVQLLCLAPSDGLDASFADEPNINVSGQLSPDSLTEELACCDAGLVLHPNAGNTGQVELGCELFEYVAAGLPILAPNTAAYKAFLGRYPVGRIYGGVLDLPRAVRELVSDGGSPAADSLPFMEDEIGRLERLYMRAMASRRRRGPGTVLKLNRQEIASPPAATMKFESAELIDLVAQMAGAANPVS